MDLEIIGGIMAVPLIMGVVELAKRSGFNTKYAGLLAVVLGLVLSFAYTFFKETPYFTAGVIGLALGLSAAGLYSTAKNAKE
jgi:4-hydroxybenzoate polyprenyltransferase